jgi:hypothetical protein
MSGERLESAAVRLLQRGTQKDVSDAFSKESGIYSGRNIPYGEYLLSVESGGTRPHEQILHVYQPDVSIRVFMRLARITDESPTGVTGTVAGRRLAKEELWVRMVPLLSNQSFGEAKVHSDGTFQITGLDNGLYVLALMQGTKVRYLKQVQLYGHLKLHLKPF